MKSVEFCYWLQGFFELAASDGGEAVSLTPRQVDVIRNQLSLVFKHEIDPSYSSDPKVQLGMQKIHDGLSKPKLPYSSITPTTPRDSHVG